MVGVAIVVWIGVAHIQVGAIQFLTQLGWAGMSVVWNYVHVHHVLVLRALHVHVLLFLCVLHILFDNCCMWFVFEEEVVLTQGHMQGREVVEHCTAWLALVEDMLAFGVAWEYTSLLGYTLPFVVVPPIVGGWLGAALLIVVYVRRWRTCHPVEIVHLHCWPFVCWLGWLGWN